MSEQDWLEKLVIGIVWSVAHTHARAKLSNPLEHTRHARKACSLNAGARTHVWLMAHMGTTVSVYYSISYSVRWQRRVRAPGKGSN